MEQNFDPSTSLLLADLDDKHPAESDDLVLDDWLGGLISETPDVSEYPEDTVTSALSKAGYREFPTVASTPDLMGSIGGAMPSHHELRNRQPLRSAFSLGDLQALQNAPQSQWSRFPTGPRLESVPEASVEFQPTLGPDDIPVSYPTAQPGLPPTPESIELQPYSMQPYCATMTGMNCGMGPPGPAITPGYLPMYYPQPNNCMLPDQQRQWQPFQPVNVPAEHMAMQVGQGHMHPPPPQQPQGFPELTHTTGSVYTAAAMQFMPPSSSAFTQGMSQPIRETCMNPGHPMNAVPPGMEDPSGLYSGSRLPLRKSQSAVELNSWRRSFHDLENTAGVDLGGDPLKVGKLTPEERLQKILRYRQKRNDRNFKRVVKYQCRKTLADSRPRVRGRFARNDDPQSIMPHQFKKVLRAKEGHDGQDLCDDDSEIVKKEENVMNAHQTQATGPVGSLGQEWGKMSHEQQYSPLQLSSLWAS